MAHPALQYPDNTLDSTRQTVVQTMEAVQVLQKTLGDAEKGLKLVSGVTRGPFIFEPGKEDALVQLGALSVRLLGASGTAAGLMDAEDKEKLDGIEEGATADQTSDEIVQLYEENPDARAPFRDATETITGDWDFAGALTIGGVAPVMEIPFDLDVWGGDTSPGVSEILRRYVTVRDITFAADFAGSAGAVSTPPAASYVVDILDDGVIIGTVTIDTLGAYTFATTSNEAKTVAAGSMLVARASGTNDPALTGMAFTLAGLVA